MATEQERPISDLAKIFPEMTPGEFAALVESIREEGLRDPIALWQGQVIDGRHRYAACAEAGVQPRFHHLADDDDPLRYVLAKNALRRHLTESQRAVVAHRLSAGSAAGPDNRITWQICRFLLPCNRRQTCSGSARGWSATPAGCCRWAAPQPRRCARRSSRARSR